MFLININLQSYLVPEVSKQLLPHLTTFCQNPCYGRLLAIWTAFVHCILGSTPNGQRRMSKYTVRCDCRNSFHVIFEDEFLAEDHDLLEHTLCGLLACIQHKHNLQWPKAVQRSHTWQRLVPNQILLLHGKIFFSSLLTSQSYPCLARSKPTWFN